MVKKRQAAGSGEDELQLNKQKLLAQAKKDSFS